MQNDQDPLAGWVPFRLLINEPVPLVQWIYVYDQPFSHPFFDETVAHCRSHPYNSSRYKSVSSLESMLEWAELLPEITPDAFIFHVSRCGSTLLSQLIGLDTAYTTLSEVPFFDEILRMHYKLKIERNVQEDLFAAAVKLIGKRRNHSEKKLFIKADSWHIFYEGLFRKLYPDTPLILLYRSPDEVEQSHQKLRGMHAVPGLIEPDLFGLAESEIEKFTLEDYIAYVLEKYLEKFDDIYKNDRHALLLDYKQGVLSMIEETANYLNISWTEEHLLQMTERSKFHSKHPGQNFKEDSIQKNIPEYLKKATSLYQQLDRSRLSAALKK